MDEKFIALTQEWHTKGWNARQGEIDELKAQLECCRKENAVLLGKAGELQKRIDVIENWINENKFHATETWIEGEVISVDDLNNMMRGNHD